MSQRISVHSNESSPDAFVRKKDNLSVKFIVNEIVVASCYLIIDHAFVLHLLLHANSHICIYFYVNLHHKYSLGWDFIKEKRSVFSSPVCSLRDHAPSFSISQMRSFQGTHWQCQMMFFGENAIYWKIQGGINYYRETRGLKLINTNYILGNKYKRSSC